MQMRYCLYVPEGKTCRIDTSTTDKRIKWLYTDGFTSCNIIIIHNQEKTKFSMTHANAAINENHIQDEISWVGGIGISKRFIITRDGRRLKKLFPSLADKFMIGPCEAAVDSVSIDTKGNIQCNVVGGKPIFFSHPEQLKAYCYSRLNMYLSFVYSETTTLLYDGDKWQGLGEDETSLAPKAQEFVDIIKAHYRKHPELMPLHPIAKDLIERARKRNQWAGEAIKTEEVTDLIHCAIHIITDYNHSQIFINQVKEEAKLQPHSGLTFVLPKIIQSVEEDRSLFYIGGILNKFVIACLEYHSKLERLDGFDLEILKKYNLPDCSIDSLEKGLRCAMKDNHESHARLFFKYIRGQNPRLEDEVKRFFAYQRTVEKMDLPEKLKLWDKLVTDFFKHPQTVRAQGIAVRVAIEEKNKHLRVVLS